MQQKHTSKPQRMGRGALWSRARCRMKPAVQSKSLQRLSCMETLCCALSAALSRSAAIQSHSDKPPLVHTPLGLHASISCHRKPISGAKYSAMHFPCWSSMQHSHQRNDCVTSAHSGPILSRLHTCGVTSALLWDQALGPCCRERSKAERDAEIHCRRHRLP